MTCDRFKLFSTKLQASERGVKHKIRIFSGRVSNSDYSYPVSDREGDTNNNQKERTNMVPKNDSNDNSTATTTQDREGRSGVFVSMPKDQHKDLKIRAIQAGQTLQTYVSNLLSEAIGTGNNTRRRGARNG